MSHERSLDGNGWQVRGCLGGSWRWYMGPDKPWDGPTRDNIDSIHRLDAADNGMRLVLSSPAPFFDAAAKRDDLPTYVGDLQHHAVGCYSAHSGVKRWNRRSEHLLLAAERWATVAGRLCGSPSLQGELARAWKPVLFNQLHDILAGTAIAPAYEDARDQYGFACTVAADVLNPAVQSVGRRINIPAQTGTLPYVVFYPCPWPVTKTWSSRWKGCRVAR